MFPLWAFLIRLDQNGPPVSSTPQARGFTLSFGVPLVSNRVSLTPVPMPCKRAVVAGRIQRGSCTLGSSYSCCAVARSRQAAPPRRGAFPCDAKKHPRRTTRQHVWLRCGDLVDQKQHERTRRFDRSGPTLPLSHPAGRTPTAIALTATFRLLYGSPPSPVRPKIAGL